MDKNTSRCRAMLFSTGMVKAILRGNKTKTRRIVKAEIPTTVTKIIRSDIDNDFYELWEGGSCTYMVRCSFNVGDTIWVRETFAEKDNRVIYRADVCSKWDLPDGFKWKPSLFMPKKHCRLFLEVTGVRIERLQDISEEEAKAEGVCSDDTKTAVECFQTLWASINGQASWDENPYVFVYDFKVVEAPISFLVDLAKVYIENKRAENGQLGECQTIITIDLSKTEQGKPHWSLLSEHLIHIDLPKIED